MEEQWENSVNNQKYISMCGPDETLQNGLDLTIQAVIGIDQSLFFKNVQFSAEDTLMYSCGPHIVLFDIISSKFLVHPREDPDLQVTLLKVANNEEGTVTLIGEAGANKPPRVTIQSTQSIYQLMHWHLEPSDHITQASISNDSIFAYSLSGTRLSIWILEAQKLLTHIQLIPNVKLLEASPSEPHICVLAGKGYLKVWEIFPERKAIEEDKQSLYSGAIDVIEMQFIPESASSLLILTAESKLILFKDWKLHSEIQTRNIGYCLACSTQECMIGGEGKVEMYLFDQDYNFQFLRTSKIPMKEGKIICGSYSPDEEQIVIAGRNDNGTELFLIECNEGEVSSALGFSLHSKAIKGSSSSSGKDLFLSYGMDKSLKVWSHTTTWKGIAQEYFSEVPTRAAIHPSGFQLAVGFENNLKVFYLLYDSFSVALSSPKKCEAVAYSECGRFLSFAQNNLIAVYDPYTLTLLHTLSGHPGSIIYLHWHNSVITSVCNHGKVYSWRIGDSPTKLIDFTNSSSTIKQAFYDPEIDNLVTLSANGTIRVWGENGSNLVYEAKERDFSCMFVCKELSAIILGLKQGILRVMLWPIIEIRDSDPNSVQEAEWMEWKLHSGPVTSIDVSSNFNAIFTTGEDSSVVCLLPKLIRNGKPQKVPIRTEDKSLNSLSLVPQSFLELQAEEVQQLQDTIKTLESDHFKLEQQEKKFEEEIAKVSSNFDKEIAAIKEESIKVDALIEEKTNQFKIQREEKETQQKNRLINQNDRFNRMLNEEFEKYDKLHDEMEQLRSKFSQQRDQILLAHSDIMKRAQSDYEARLSKVMQAHDQLQNTYQEEKVKYEAMVVQTDEDYEELIKKKKIKQKKEVDEEKKKARECLGKQAKLIRDNAAMQKELQVLNDRSAELREENKNLEKECQSINERLIELEKEMEKREEIIKKKESTIKELRSLHIHLQNFRFVLDQKIKALKDERAPMEEQDMHLQEHIQNLFSELLEEHTSHSATNDQLKQLKQKSKDALKTNHSLREEMVKSRNKLELLYSDLALLLQEKDKDQMIFRLKDLYYKHVGRDDLYPSKEPIKQTLNEHFMKIKQDNVNNIKTETEKQGEFMQSMLNQMQLSKVRVEKEQSKQILLKQQENAKLIKECNDLRSDKEQLQKKKSELEAMMKRLNFSLKGGALPEPAPKKTKPKDTPFQEIQKKQAFLNQTEFYKTKSRPDFKVKSLIKELEKNRTEYAKQNNKFQEVVLKEFTPSTTFLSHSTLPRS